MKTNSQIEGDAALAEHRQNKNKKSVDEEKGTVAFPEPNSQRQDVEGCPDCGCPVGRHNSVLVPAGGKAEDSQTVVHCGGCGTCWKTKGTNFVEMVRRYLNGTESLKTSELSVAHTPGPWSLTNDGTYIRPDCLKGTKCLVDEGVVSESWPAICDVMPWPQDRWNCLGPDETLANARLIAAAPALYSAAKAAMEWFAAFPHQSGASHFEITTAEELYNQLSAALAEPKEQTK